MVGVGNSRISTDYAQKSPWRLAHNHQLTCKDTRFIQRFKKIKNKITINVVIGVSLTPMWMGARFSLLCDHVWLNYMVRVFLSFSRVGFFLYKNICKWALLSFMILVSARFNHFLYRCVELVHITNLNSFFFVQENMRMPHMVFRYISFFLDWRSRSTWLSYT